MSNGLLVCGTGGGEGDKIFQKTWQFQKIFERREFFKPALNGIDITYSRVHKRMLAGSN